MTKSEVGKPRGILHPQASGEEFQHARLAPAPDLGFFIAHYWSVSWDLSGQAPRLAETLPHPSVHLVFERGKSPAEYARICERAHQNPDEAPTR